MSCCRDTISSQLPRILTHLVSSHHALLLLYDGKLHKAPVRADLQVGISWLYADVHMLISRRQHWMWEQEPDSGPCKPLPVERGSFFPEAG